ncbi:MAG: CerR family C-terminal domain-containing protein [Gemmatales bacterium]|nr:CerR family C-terminal domain-containing protein [Gemmatales bacterium]MDW8386344.1 CerR family C-terminal domain-containing protein [Gemmatales bacterium]
MPEPAHVPSADATQQRLLQAAGEVFAEKGYHAATVREICARAGVHNIAAINYYFRDKETLYAETLRFAARSPLYENLTTEWPATAKPAEKLRWFIGLLVEKIVLACRDRPLWHMQLMMRELTQPSPIGERIAQEFIRPVYETLWAILREALPPGLSERKLHLISFSIVGQCMYHRLARHVIRIMVGEDEQATYDAETLTDHITEFSCRALGLDWKRPGPKPGTKRVSTRGGRK